MKTEGSYFSEINVTPLTDVFLVLLVIMILVAPIVNSNSVLKVDPPLSDRCGRTPPPASETVAIRVQGDGQVFVNGANVRPATSISIESAIRRYQKEWRRQDIPVSVESEQDARQKDVVAVMDAAAGAGVKSLRILPLKEGLKDGS